MKMSRKIKNRIKPSSKNGFVSISRHYFNIGYYKNRGLPIPLSGKEIGRIESVRVVMSSV